MRRFIAFFFLLMCSGGCTTKYQEIRDCRSGGQGTQETGAPYDPGKAVLYGRFISLAYAMYQKSPSDLTPDPAPDFPLGYELTAWIQMGTLSSATPRRYFMASLPTAVKIQAMRFSQSAARQMKSNGGTTAMRSE